MTGGLGNAALVAVIAIVPLVVLMLTSFVKISVVLSLLRNAIGAPEAPSGLVVMGLSLILTFFVMMPVALDMVHAAASAAPAPPVPAPPVPAPSAPRPASVAPSPAGSLPAPPGTAPVPAASTPASPSGSPALAGSTSVSPSAAPAPVPPGAVSAPSDAAPVPPSAVSAPSGAASAPVSNAPATAPAQGVSAAAEPPGSSQVVTRPLELDGELRELVPAPYRPQVDAAARALGPLRGFLARHASARDRETFTVLAARMGRSVAGDELWILAPAFVTTELREAFAIAVLVFVPFLVLDLVVGLGLAALGLMSTSPQTIALPLKLLLFVSVDGWRLLIEGLLRGYA